MHYTCPELTDQEIVEIVYEIMDAAESPVSLMTIYSPQFVKDLAYNEDIKYESCVDRATGTHYYKAFTRHETQWYVYSSNPHRVILLAYLVKLNAIPYLYNAVQQKRNAKSRTAEGMRAIIRNSKEFMRSYRGY